MWVAHFMGQGPRPNKKKKASIEEYSSLSLSWLLMTCGQLLMLLPAPQMCSHKPWTKINSSLLNLLVLCLLPQHETSRKYTFAQLCWQEPTFKELKEQTTSWNPGMQRALCHEPVFSGRLLCKENQVVREAYLTWLQLEEMCVKTFPVLMWGWRTVWNDIMSLKSNGEVGETSSQWKSKGIWVTFNDSRLNKLPTLGCRGGRRVSPLKKEWECKFCHPRIHPD